MPMQQSMRHGKTHGMLETYSGKFMQGPRKMWECENHVNKSQWMTS